MSLMRSWSITDELVEHLYGVSQLDGITKEPIARFVTKMLSIKDLVHHLAFVFGAVVFGNYLYLNWDSLFDMMQL